MIGKLDNKNDVISYFSPFFEILKAEICKRFGNVNDDQLSYRNLAIRDAINSLPCSISIAKLKVDATKYDDAESDVYYLVKYDFSKFGDFSVDHHGEFDLDNIQHESGLIKPFELNEGIVDDIKTLKLIYYKNIEQWLWFWLLSQITLENPEKYARDFLHFFEFTFQNNIIKKFGREIDYVEKYNLQSDPILSSSELLQIDRTAHSIFKPRNDDDSKVLEDLQRDVCEIQLIPTVPEGVKKVFNAAKKLYVFGYFEYYFFTISNHYAFLAVESALRNRYNEVFGKPKKFVQLDTIITKLLGAKIIREAEKHFYDIAKSLRNSLSHLTRPSVFMPSKKILENAAFSINQLYEDYKYK